MSGNLAPNKPASKAERQRRQDGRINVLVVGYRGPASDETDLILSNACNIRRIKSFFFDQIPSSYGKIDLIIVDSVFDNLDVMEIIHNLARRLDMTYILARAETDDEIDRVLALEAGADECVPFSCGDQEIKARIRAYLRRRAGIKQSASPRLELRSQFEEKSVPRTWTFDQQRSRLYAPNGQLVSLTPVEQSILLTLTEDAGAVKDRATLMKRCGCGGPHSTERTLDVNIGRLRRKIANFYHRKLITTVWGVGYVIAPGDVYLLS